MKKKIFKIGAKIQFVSSIEDDRKDPPIGTKGEITEDHGMSLDNTEHYWRVEFDDGSNNQMRQSELKLLA